MCNTVRLSHFPFIPITFLIIYLKMQVIDIFNTDDQLLVYLNLIYLEYGKTYL